MYIFNIFIDSGYLFKLLKKNTNLKENCINSVSASSVILVSTHYNY